MATTSRLKDLLVNATLFLTIALVIVGLLAVTIHLSPAAYALRLNGYGLLSLAATLVDIALIFQIVRVGKRSEVNNWFLLFIVALSFYGISETLQRFSAHAAGARLWERMSGIGFNLAAPALLLFVITYSERKRTPRLLMPLLILGAAVISFMDSMPGTIFSNDPSHLYPWGYYGTYSKHGYLLVFFWLLSIFIVSILILYQHYKTVKEDVLKKQTKYFILAIAVPLEIAIITDGLLPAFSINSLPPLAMVMISISGMIIYIGRRQNRLFEIDSSLLASNILNTMNEAVIVTDNSFRIEQVNEAAKKLLQVSDDQMAQQAFQSLFSEASWNKIQDHLLNQKKFYEIGELSITDSQQKQIPIMLYSSALKDGQDLLAYIFVISDITDITHSYQELKKLQQQLAVEKAGVEHTVEVRTKELQDAQEKLKTADQLKSEFIMLTSHNLRTPISIVSGNTDLLKMTTLNEKQEHYVKGLKDSVERLREYTEDLLLISSIEAGDKPELETVSINEVMKPLADEGHESAAKKNLSFTFELLTDDHVLVKANVVRLRSALRNVVDNAFKFTKEGTVTVRVTSQQDTAIISVEDTGTGIPPDEVQQLFTMFHRGTSTLHFSYEGKGIGLKLAKLVIDEHGGTITAKSTLGVGTSLLITLPLATNTTVAAPSAKPVVAITA